MTNGSDDAARLSEFFERLAQDAALYNDYLTNPVATMRSASIPEELISAVMQGNVKKLNKLFAEDSERVVILGTIVRT